MDCCRAYHIHFPSHKYLYWRVFLDFCAFLAGHLRIFVTVGAILIVLQLIASAEAGPLKKPRRSIVSGNAWEHPCGDGSYQERSDNRRSAKQMKKNYIKDVYTQSRRMGKQLDRKEQDSSFLPDGDWDHTLPDFEFPDLSRFTFVSIIGFVLLLHLLPPDRMWRSFVSVWRAGDCNDWPLIDTRSSLRYSWDNKDWIWVGEELSCDENAMSAIAVCGWFVKKKNNI